MSKTPKQVYYKNNIIQQIKGFFYTVKTGSMSAAAKKIGLSQGAVSLQIQSLEKRLETKLFERKGSKLLLTKEGKLFYVHCAPHIYGIQNLISDFTKTLEKENSHKISIAASNVGVCHILPKYIKKFEELHPKADFEIKNLPREEAIKKLTNDEVKILIYSMNIKEIPSDLDFTAIAQYDPILLTSKNHPLAKNKRLTMSEIAKHKILRLDQKFVTLPNFDEAIKHYGLKTKIDFEMANYEVLKKFVREDIGIAIVSGICMEGEVDPNLVGRKLNEFFPKILYGILTKKGQPVHGLAKDFINLLMTEKLIEAHITAENK